MTVHKILVASVTLNALLLASIGYVLGLRSTDAPISGHSSQVGNPIAIAGRLATPSPLQVSSFQPSNPAVTPLSVVSTSSPQSAAIVQFPSRAAVSGTADLISRPNTVSEPSPSISSSPAGVNSPSEIDGAVAIDSAAPGNSIHFQGMRVAVAQNLGTSRGGQPSLNVDVTPDIESNSSVNSPGSANSATGLQASIVPGAADAANPAPDQPRSSNSQPVSNAGGQPPGRPKMQVFTEEENLFRTKWGWAAFDQMRRQAALEAATKTSAQ